MTKDMMRGFDLYQPANLENALNLTARLGKDAWLMAGGNDSLDWFKDRVKNPVALIDLLAIDSLKGIRETAEGIEIGATTTLTEIANSDLVKSRYNLLAEAASHVASPQIRNVSTIGGNLCQDARCWYYRAGLDCYRAGGKKCYADTPEGMNREHCLFAADRCVAVSPSDTAPALVALDATCLIHGPEGQRSVKAEDFFIGPAVDIERMTVLEENEILTAIQIPDRWAGANFYFEKVADRNTWDFALVNVACAMRLNNGTIEDVRIACSGVECVPKRLTVVESVVKGSPVDDEIAALAGKSAIRGATPLNYNHFKIPLLENLVKRAIRNS
ncbi:MAG: xanthine dehydrogenase family protein subunit M [Gammaproteobacteria bacterium]|jgi:xanthine dehydrogenase YagS FAD-binding subunit|nr:xanthine dehydrogenase family protein subunit M [Gammaproteobacteria bacterium]MBT5202654.1 xanthine dehydrogenase family protein subunit M [Gammaproteobacteria bacterium]MBT5603883.1 xanthine dehydrogenase family protein subunit M [Gammaproteobacteria bacterium]MBT6244270.1 xanthine dehydrogenase family protein subunit M [Gammaproteobacteria bacterium]